MHMLEHTAHSFAVRRSRNHVDDTNRQWLNHFLYARFEKKNNNKKKKKKKTDVLRMAWRCPSVRKQSSRYLHYIL